MEPLEMFGGLNQTSAGLLFISKGAIRKKQDTIGNTYGAIRQFQGALGNVQGLRRTSARLKKCVVAAQLVFEIAFEIFLNASF